MKPRTKRDIPGKTVAEKVAWLTGVIENTRDYHRRQQKEVDRLLADITLTMESLGHDRFADTVIGVSLKPSLPTFQGPKFSFGRTSPFSLKILPSMGKLPAVLLNVLSAINGSVTVNGNVDNAKIHTKNISRFDNLWFVHITDNRHVPLPTDEHQIDLALPKRKQSALLFSVDTGNLFSSGNEQDGYSVIGHKTENLMIIRLGRVLTELNLRPLGGLVSVCNFGNTANNRLCLQTKFGFGLIIDKPMQSVLSKSFGLPCSLGNPITSIVTGFQCTLQDGRLFGSREEFKVHNQFHSSKYRNFQLNCQRQERRDQ